MYTNPTDPSFKGFRPGSLFYGTEVGNRLPSSAYASYDLVEGARSLLAAALKGETSVNALSPHAHIPQPTPSMASGQATCSM